MSLDLDNNSDKVTMTDIHKILRVLRKYSNTKIVKKILKEALE
jgi:hypothetical protein